jgi:hypothetical protein
MGFLSFETSKTSSSTSNATGGADQRIAQGDQSANWGVSNEGMNNVSTGQGGAYAGAGGASVGMNGALSLVNSSGAGNTVNILDQGAVSKSLELAYRGIDQANATTQAVVQQSGSLLAGIFDASNSTTKQLGSAVETIKTSDLRAMGFALVGLVAIAWVWKAKG